MTEKGEEKKGRKGRAKEVGVGSKGVRKKKKKTDHLVCDPKNYE
jgi:hypothetical protein